MNPAQTAHSRKPRIFISAAEPSADLHAASLMREIRRFRPETRFVGIAGPKMRAENCRPVADLTATAGMLTGVVANAGRAAAALRDTDREFSSRRYDAAVLLDSPMLNLPIALRAKSRAIPVLYYIAPQLWAWGAYRVHKLRARVDKLAVVLPFEQRYFRHAGLDATYVGHPLFDALIARTVDPRRADAIRSSGSPIIAVLPGSRRHVIREVLPGQIEVAAAVRARHPRAHIAVSVADPDLTGLMRAHADRTRTPVTLYQGENPELLSAADITLVASGTATLEVAYYGSPMIVMYNGSRLMYHLVARWLVSLDHLSLINILADRKVVPEFMPYYDSTAPIARTALELLASPEHLARMRRDLADTIAPLNEPGASARTAAILLDMIDPCDHV